MLTRTASFLLLFLGLSMFANSAYAQDELHGYFVDVAVEAKAAETPEAKRDILNRGLTRMNQALTQVQKSPAINAEDVDGIRQLQSGVQDKIDELNGVGGFERIADSQLDAFADYMVQDIEQAQRVTISLVALLLIIIIVVLVT